MKTTVLALLIAIISLTSIADEQNPQRMQRIIDQLSLSDEQTPQVQAIFENQRNQREKIHQQMAALHQNTRQQMSAILNPEQLSKFDQISQARRDKKQRQHRAQND